MKRLLSSDMEETVFEALESRLNVLESALPRQLRLQEVQQSFQSIQKQERLLSLVNLMDLSPSLYTSKSDPDNISTSVKESTVIASAELYTDSASKLLRLQDASRTSQEDSIRMSSCSQQTEDLYAAMLKQEEEMEALGDRSAHLANAWYKRCIRPSNEELVRIGNVITHERRSQRRKDFAKKHEE